MEVSLLEESVFVKLFLQRKSVFVRPLPNADFLSSDWFMRL